MNIFGKRVKPVYLFSAIIIIALGTAAWFYWPLKEEKAKNPGSKIVISYPGEKREELIVRECLINDNGIPVKVLTKRHGVHCTTERDGTQQIGPDLGLFRPYYVFDQNPNPSVAGKVTYYQIGPSMMKKDIWGWVSSINAQRWDTRLGVEYGWFTEDADPAATKPLLPRLYVFASKDDLNRWLQGEKVEPVAKAELSEETKNNLMPWPIISKETVEFSGRNLEIYEIAFLGEYREGTVIEKPPAPPSEKAPVDPKEKKAYGDQKKADSRKVDVVFCIDATGSMQPYIDQVKTAVKNFTTNLKNSKYQPDLSFGLVEYRDYEEGYSDKSVAKIYAFEKDVEKFGRLIDSLEANAGGDEREAVFDALINAISFQWQADISQRLVILVGDNSGHDDLNQNPNNLDLNKVLQEAQKDKVRAKIFTLKAPCRSAEPEVQRHANQFDMLAKVTDGKSFSLENANDVVPAIEEILKKGQEESEEMGQAIDWLTTGDLKPPSDNTPEAISRVSSDRDICRVLTIMAKANVDWEKLAPGQITFSTGWVCPESADTPILNKKVYISKPELHTLKANLAILVAGLYDPSSLEAMIYTAKAPRIGISSFFTEKNSILNMNEHLLDDGLAVGEHSLLKFSLRELMTKSEGWRLAMGKKIDEQYLPKLANSLRDNSAFPDSDELSYGWIWETYLP